MTFWELIEGNKIEVPVIQRDYAQGREEDKVNTIRKDFVTDILRVLNSEENESLHLGFVYGKIEGKDKYIERERNKRAIENILNAVEGYAQQLDLKINTDISSIDSEKNDSLNLPTFIPLDGQQRLTTLYLLHWYLAVFSENNELNKHLITLSNFSYKTRKSSMEFCDAICKETNVSSIIGKKGDLSEGIQNKKWFRKIWIKDSTVKGMLVMLSEIHEQSKDNPNKLDMFNRLLNQNESIISFDFLDLNELNQTDELYVKMNARGKQLSEFEHFKAWLQNQVSVLGISTLILDKDWKFKLDGIWLDLFWKNKEYGVYHIDDVIYHAFKQISLFEFISTSVNPVDIELTKVIRENSYLSFSYFEKNNFFNSLTLNFLFSSLNALSNSGEISKYESWLEDIVNDSFFGSEVRLSTYFLKNIKTIERPESVFYFAFLLFLISSKNKNSKENFKAWMRFSRNIIFNTYIQNPENFIDAIVSLNSLKPQIDSIESHITSPNTKILFFGDAVKQEVIKVNLRNDITQDWKAAIDQAENHLYFKGDIGFLLELSKKENIYDLNDFKFYTEIASLLFVDKIRNHNEKILQRALLTCGNYLPKVGSNNLFPLSNRESLRARRDNWQKVFNNAENLKTLRIFLDKLKGNLTDVESHLSKMIEDYQTKDWKWYFIKSAVAIQFCKQGFIRFNTENNIILLRTSRIYGSHAELRSYFNYYYQGLDSIKNFSPFKSMEYWKNPKGQYTFSCIRFSGWNSNNQSYNLEINYTKDEYFLIQIVNEEKMEINQKIIGILQKENWQISDDMKKCFKFFTEESELKGLISKTLDSLSKIL